MNSNKIFCWIVLVFSATHLFSQGEHNIWYFGANAGVDFNSGTPVALSDGNLDTWEACGSVCSASGDLLFYTDAIVVWNRNHAVMPNSTWLMGDVSTSQLGIVPRPQSNDQYYIFSLQEENGLPGGIYYSIVDMTLEGGLGDVTLKNVQLVDLSTEKISIVQHANGIDYWIVVHKPDSGIYQSFLLTSSGISSSPVESDVGVYLSGVTGGEYTGCMKVSPSGEIVAAAHGAVGTEMLFFDDQTGLLTLWMLIEEDHYGVEFSPSGRFLYASHIGNSIHQFDLEAGTASQVYNSKVALGENLAWNGYGPNGIQIAPNGKIYIAIDASDYLAVIHFPDVSGVACNFIENGVYLNGRTCTFGLPIGVPSTKLESPASPPVDEPFAGNFPNVFTPNNDESNDHFIVHLDQEVVTSSGVILNRWGEVVYKGDLLKIGWDGTTNSKPCKDGVYFWEIEYETVDKGLQTKSGYVHLLR